MTHGDCQRLAYYAWDLRDYKDPERRALATQLANAAMSCGGANQPEGARLTVASASLHATPEIITKVIAIVETPVAAVPLADALEELDAKFFEAVRARGVDLADTFLAAWSLTMETVANDPAVIDADQLAAIGARLTVIKAFAKDQKVPDDVAASARARVSAALAKKFDPYVRARRTITWSTWVTSKKSADMS